jgi:hypothetical protein
MARSHPFSLLTEHQEFFCFPYVVLEPSGMDMDMPGVWLLPFFLLETSSKYNTSINLSVHEI